MLGRHQSCEKVCCYIVQMFHKLTVQHLEFMIQNIFTYVINQLQKVTGL